MQCSSLYQINCEDLEEVIKKAVADAMKGLIIQTVPEPEIKYLTGDEVDALLHITAMTRNNWVDKGFLKKYKVGRRVLFRSDEVIGALKAEVQLKYKRQNVR